MALMYPWATKDYLLYQMSLGQVIMYYNLGIERLYPEAKDKEAEVYDKYAQAKKELKEMGLLGEKDKEKEKKHEELKDKFGEID